MTPGEEEEHAEEEMSKLQMILGVAVVGVLSFLFGKFVFTLVPVFLAEFLKPWFPGKTVQILLETGFKLILLLAYLYFISLAPIIKRVFQYHGAEHKVINCYEAGLPLTVENVKINHVYITVAVQVLFYLRLLLGCLFISFSQQIHYGLRLISRILLIPVVLGISFEVLQATNAVRNVPVLRYLGYPGLMVTTVNNKRTKR